MTTLMSRKVRGFIAVLGALLLLAYFLIARTFQAKREATGITAAPHLTAVALTWNYQKNTQAARKKYDRKFIVLTGYVAGIDEGLFGDGAIHMAADNGEIECDVNGKYGRCAVRQSCTVAGTCDGMDSSGMIHLSNGHVLHPVKE